MTSAAKFTFPTFVSYCAVGIGLYLYYSKKIIAQFKIIEKMISHHTRLRQNDDLLSSGHKEKAAIFYVRSLIKREISTVRMRNAILKNYLKEMLQQS